MVIVIDWDADGTLTVLFFEGASHQFRDQGQRVGIQVLGEADEDSLMLPGSISKMSAEQVPDRISNTC